MICLARHVCRIPEQARRRDVMAALATKHGADFDAALKVLVQAEWDTVRIARHVCLLADKPSRHAYLAALKVDKGEEYVAKIEAQIHVEWALMHPQSNSGKAADGDA